MPRQAMPDSVDVTVDSWTELASSIDDLRVADGTRVWNRGGLQHGLWCLDQTSALPVGPGVAPTQSGIGRWIYFGASAGGGGGSIYLDRVDCSVNSGRVSSLYEATSYLHVQTSGGVAGGYNGVVVWGYNANNPTSARMIVPHLAVY